MEDDVLQLDRVIKETHATLCGQLLHIASTFCGPLESLDARTTASLVNALDHAVNLSHRYKVLLELRDKLVPPATAP